MKIIIIRHAIAEDRTAFAKTCSDDNLRPLTEKGIKRVEQSRQGLKRVEPLADYIFSSTLQRSIQTADLIGELYPAATRRAIPQLDPGSDPAKLTRLLAELPPQSTVLLIGHEPDLSELISWYTNGSHFNFLQLKRGAACLLQFKESPKPASAEMIWLLPPRQLRSLGQKK
ncbi:SixA phosphatase family protein [Sedimenticola sp.]|uniref:SixA phosphatase family protein n=1 Tax=Sedimenticola sp. TaxID=1940285 RepID=UPI003D11F508